MFGEMGEERYSMWFFKDILVAFIIVGLLTRVLAYFLRKKMEKKKACYWSIGLVAIITVPIVSATIGFDIAVAIYVFAIVIWVLIDILHMQVKKKRKGKE